MRFAAICDTRISVRLLIIKCVSASRALVGGGGSVLIMAIITLVLNSSFFRVFVPCFSFFGLNLDSGILLETSYEDIQMYI